MPISGKSVGGGGSVDYAEMSCIMNSGIGAKEILADRFSDSRRRAIISWRRRPRVQGIDLSQSLAAVLASEIHFVCVIWQSPGFRLLLCVALIVALLRTNCLMIRAGI